MDFLLNFGFRIADFDLSDKGFGVLGQFLAVLRTATFASLW